ncbi:helix-turn-helix domain-containing protein [Streptomyces sp. NPDC020898]|uniref:helix-turn-helix domain-containing protein n=1 Tax=Streptomyces sp. NPDC020898 TaxID=3365101 RepID=UPI0037883EAE
MAQRRTVTSRSQEPRARFAEELKALRERSGDSLRQLGDKVGWDFSMFGKMENGHTLGSADVVVALDQYFGTDTFLVTLWELALGDKSEFKEEYREYMRLESEAVSLWHFGVTRIPGMLQTRGYATEVLAAGDIRGEELARQVEARLSRAELLTRAGGPHFRTILYEAALRMALRERGAWREQLDHLLEAAEHPCVTVQVLPFSAGPCSLDSTDVMFLKLPNGRVLAYTETAHRGELIEEHTALDRLQPAYDAIRDLALSPAESRRFIGQMREEAPCDSST